MLDGQHSHDAAADIQKGAEGLQMRHHRSDHGAWAQVLQEEVHGPLLNGPAGEQCRGRALFIGPEGRHEKTGRLSHPGEDGDVPLGPADPGGEDLLPGDAGLDASQGEKQVVSGITPEDPILQHRVLLHGLPQALERERRGRAQALRRIQLVFRHIVIASYLPQRRRVVPYRYYMQPGRLL